MRKLRVLVLTPLGQGGRGGIDRMMDEVRSEIARDPPGGIEVEFVTTRGQGNIFFSGFLVAAAALRIVGIPGGRPDLLHINLAQDGSALRKAFLAKIAGIAGVPYLIHLHGSRFRTSWERAPAVAKSALRRFFAEAACVLVLGTVWKAFVVSKVPTIADRIEILPNATPFALDRAPRADGDGPRILFLGVLSERKGTPILIQALGALSDMPKWRATLAGNGDVAGARASIAGLALEDRVDIPGWVGPDDVRRLLRESDILVLPSNDENLPMSVIEGMANGLAVVTTPVGAVEDIIQNERTGLLTPPGDAEALEAALRRLISDPALRAALGGAAKEFHRANLEIGAYYLRLLTIWRRIGTRGSTRS